MRNAAIIYMVISVASFQVVNAMAKAMPDIPVHELIFFRSLVSFSFCAWYVTRYHIPFWGNNKFWLIMRGLMGYVALTLFFLTVKHMPLASASTIQYLSPVFTVFVAMFLNDQKVAPIQWLFFAISLLGTILIKGFDVRVEPVWLGVGVVSALFAGLAYNAIIRAKGTDHPMTIVMYFPLVALPISGSQCLVEWVQPQGWQWLMLFVMGAMTQVAQYFTTLALHSDVASRVTPWTYFGAVFAILIGYFAFDEHIEPLSMVGMALVVTGVLLNTWWGRTSAASR